MATPPNVRIITRFGSTPAFLAVPDEDGDELPYLVVKGLRRMPDDLATGTYLEVDDPDLAIIAAQAGFFVGKPTTWGRRCARYGARLIGVGSALAALLALFWVIRDLVAGDLLGAVFVGLLGIFMAFIAVGYLGAGEQILLGDIASRQRANRRIRKSAESWLKGRHRKGSAGMDRDRRA